MLVCGLQADEDPHYNAAANTAGTEVTGPAAAENDVHTNLVPIEVPAGVSIVPAYHTTRAIDSPATHPTGAVV